MAKSKYKRDPALVNFERRPTRDELLAANDVTIQDTIAPNLNVLFVGINPGLYSGATGHHFARPGNRFWPALFAGGFTPRLFAPFERRLLLDLGFGVTNIVARATNAADELSPDELLAGGKAMRRKLLKYKPKIAAVLGIGAYRSAFGEPDQKLGLQKATISDTRLWVLPNPSGLNAHYTPVALGKLFAELRQAAEAQARA